MLLWVLCGTFCRGIDGPVYAESTGPCLHGITGSVCGEFLVNISVFFIFIMVSYNFYYIYPLLNFGE